LDTVDAALMAGIVKARARLMQELPENLRSAVEFFDEAKFSPANSLIDNILFGRLAPGQNAINSRMRQLMRIELERLDLLNSLGDMAVDVGLQTPVGVGGSRLTPVMRQRVAIARALLKGPPLLVLDDPAALLDQAAQTQLIDAVLAEPGWGIVWVLQRPALAKAFERVLVLDQGRIVADGPFASVVQNGDILARPETIDEKPQEPG
jgi:ABC-type multidrug transport system fused ATPase/permease subunit